MNRLYFGDNLEIMREMESEHTDLICTDPPFNSGRDYNAFFPESQAQKKAYTDIWKWDDRAINSRQDIREKAEANDTYKALDMCLQGYDLVLQKAVKGNKGAMRAYLAFMGPRLAEMHRILKDTGSIYLHCDPTASHYLKALMDSLFGSDNFRNEVIWKRTSTKSLAKRYAVNTDRILYYIKSNGATWNQQYTPYDAEYIQKNFRNQDKHGKYGTADLSGGKAGSKKAYMPLKGIEPPPGRAWAPPTRNKFPASAQALLPDNYETLDQLSKCEALDEAGLLHWSKGKIGRPQWKKYLSAMQGIAAGDLILDTPPVRGKEKLDYDTQKPRKLYERMIKASSNEGDLVMDPFCGCGTTIDAAHTLKRNWIGIDLTIIALDPINKRMRDRHTNSANEPLQPHKDYEIVGYPTNMQEVYKLVRNEKKQHDFANWAVTRLGMIPTPDVRDGGKDGIGTVMLWDPETDYETDKRIISEVKTGKPTISQVRDFCHVMTQQSAIAGIFITLERITDGMKQIAEDMGVFTLPNNNTPYPKLQFWQITDAYFENPNFLRDNIRLPYNWIIPRKKSERHFDNQQLQLLPS